jgi:hypothetical protein
LIGIGGELTEFIKTGEAVDYVLKGGVIYILGIITKIPPYFLWPMAFANYCKSGEKMGAAFKLWEIIPKTFAVMGDYVLSLLLIVSVNFALLLIVIVGNAVIPLAGMLLNFVLSFYFHYIVFDALFGSVCSEAYSRNSTSAEPQ